MLHHRKFAHFEIDFFPRFVLSLLSFNLVATMVLLPLILMDSLIDVSVYSHATVDYAVCVAGQAVTTLVTTGSISAALVIAVDQYCAVMAPLHYHRRVTKAKAWLLLAGQWILAIAMAAFSLPDSSGKYFWKGCASSSRRVQFIPALSTDDVTDDEELNVTTVAPPVNGTAGSAPSGPEVWTTLFVSSSVFCYVVPLALLTWMYLRIYSAAHRNSQRTRRTSLTHSASELVVHCLGQQSSNSSPLSGSLIQMNSNCASNNNGTSSSVSSCQSPAAGGGSSGSAAAADLLLPPPAMSRTPSLRSTSSQIVHNLRYRISNASLFLYREEARAARVSVLVLVLVVCCWMPYHVILALHTWAGWDERLPSYAYHLTLVAVLINALSSPFLYAYRSRRIQREVRRLFGLPPKSRKGAHHHRELSKRRTKTLRSLSPRRQLLRKHVRDADELQAMSSVGLGGSSAGHSSSPSPRVVVESSEVRHLMAKVTRLWHSHKPAAVSSIAVPRIITCPVVSNAAAAASELAAVHLSAANICRSSFSSATSSNSTSSAESDVSL